MSVGGSAPRNFWPSVNRTVGGSNGWPHFPVTLSAGELVPQIIEVGHPDDTYRSWPQTFGAATGRSLLRSRIRSRL